MSGGEYRWKTGSECTWRPTLGKSTLVPVSGFLRGNLADLTTLRAKVHTSGIQTVDAKPEENLLERIRNVAAEGYRG